MLEGIRHIPYSARRYGADQYGNVYQDGLLLQPEFQNGHMVVELDWVQGRQKYLVALIILICFGKLRLPDHLYSRVTPLYRDGDCKNLHPVNLIYRYTDGPLEVEEYPGFYYIPLYNDYAINLQGDLINISTGKYKQWSVTKGGGSKNQTGGYYFNRVVNDEGFSKLLFLHRALCMVFKEYDQNVLDMVVNHKDGYPGNNALENLEWTTYKLNNIHAVEIGLRGQSKPILMKNLKTGDEQRFASIGACARHLGFERDTFIYRRLNQTPIKVFEDMLVFKYDDGEPWPIVDMGKVHRSSEGSDIVARNVFTGLLLIFKGSTEGEMLTGVKKDTILKHVREEMIIPIKGYNFRYLQDEIKWPEHTNRHLMIYEKYPIYPPDGVVVLNVETNEETFITSAAEAMNKFAVSKSKFYDMVRKKILFKNKYLLTLFDIRKTLGPPTE